jgi:hypothetical protein
MTEQMKDFVFEAPLHYKKKTTIDYNCLRQQEHSKQFAIYRKNVFDTDNSYSGFKSLNISREEWRNAIFLIYKPIKSYRSFVWSGEGKHDLARMFNTYLMREDFDEKMEKYCPEINRRIITGYSTPAYRYQMKHY